MARRVSAAKARKTWPVEPKPGPSRADGKRREILLAAAAEFCEKGYAETTLGDIADRLGIHTAALYYYFENKNAVVDAVLKEAALRAAASQQRSLQKAAHLSPRGKLTILIRDYLEIGVRRDDIGRAFWKIFDQVSPELRGSVMTEVEAVFSVWRDAVKEAVDAEGIRPDIPPSLFRQLLIGSMMWVPEWYRPGGENSIADVADAIIAIFLGEPLKRSSGLRVQPRNSKTATAKSRSRGGSAS